MKLTETTWIKEKFQKPEYYTDSISSCANLIQIPTEPFQLWEQFKLCSAPSYVFNLEAYVLYLSFHVTSDSLIQLVSKYNKSKRGLDVQNFLQLKYKAVVCGDK